MQNQAIDIHHHYVPQQLIEETKRHGKALGVDITEDNGSHALSFAGSKPHRLQPALMDVERRIEIMDEGQVALATLEANTNSLGYRLTAEHGETWCKLYNDCMHELVKQRPERFAGMTIVPLQDPARAAKVLEHSILDMKFRGAFIGTNVNGKYYNTKDFDPFWAKAQELDLLIVMHPEHIAGAERMGAFGLNAVCGNPADSTLSLGYMLYSGLFDRFPDLKLCALHGGGFLPYHLGRFDKEFVTGQDVRPAQSAKPPSAYLRNLYFDTLVYDVDTLEYLRSKVGNDRLMVGTDYPYTLGDWLGVEKVQACLVPNPTKTRSCRAMRVGCSNYRNTFQAFQELRIPESLLRGPFGLTIGTSGTAETVGTLSYLYRLPICSKKPSLSSS